MFLLVLQKLVCFKRDVYFDQLTAQKLNVFVEENICIPNDSVPQYHINLSYLVLLVCKQLTTKRVIFHSTGNRSHILLHLLNVTGNYRTSGNLFCTIITYLNKSGRKGSRTKNSSSFRVIYTLAVYYNQVRDKSTSSNNGKLLSIVLRVIQRFKMDDSRVYAGH